MNCRRRERPKGANNLIRWENVLYILWFSVVSVVILRRRKYLFNEIASRKQKQEEALAMTAKNFGRGEIFSPLTRCI